MTASGSSARRIVPSFVDERGSIADILEDELITAVTIITSRSGAVRGNHYHEKTEQYLYMLSGRMRLTTQMPGDQRRSVILEQGDVVLSPAIERHAMRALEDTVFLALTRGPRGGSQFESDTHRLGADELLERAED